MEIGDTFGFLLGTWDVSRVLTDHRCRTQGSFEGTAEVTEPRTLTGRRGRARYEEAGELRFGAYVGRAHRHLDVLASHDATVSLCFTDGRHYVDLDLRGGAWRTLHLCGHDRYEITTLARVAPGPLRALARPGPHIDYDARTTLRRVQ